MRRRNYCQPAHQSLTHVDRSRPHRNAAGLHPVDV